MAAAIITLEKLLANDSTLLAFGLDLPMNFFANPAWREMFFQNDEGKICIHPLGKFCHDQMGKPITLEKSFVFHKDNNTLVSHDESIILKNKDGKFYIEFESGDRFQTQGTQMIFSLESGYFRAEVFSYNLNFFETASMMSFKGERSTSYFDEHGIEIKRDKAYSVENMKRYDGFSRNEILMLLHNTDICKNYRSTIDTTYSLNEKKVLPNGSFITKMTYRRDSKRPDIAWIGPEDDCYCANLFPMEEQLFLRKRTFFIDTRLVFNNRAQVLQKMPTELTESEVEEFLSFASGDIASKKALAELFGESGKHWLVGHQNVLKKEKN